MAKLSMRASSHSPRLWALIAAATLALLLASMSASSDEPPDFTNIKMRDRDRRVLDRLCQTAGDRCKKTAIEKSGFRLSVLPGGLDRGERVRLVGSGPTSPDLVCWNRCSLYFLDLLPGAHFAHPTVVGLYDRVTGVVQTAAGQWWPIINGNHPVFDTVSSRIRSSIVQQGGIFGLPDVRLKQLPLVYSPDISIVPPETQSGQAAMTGGPTCNVRAVVVNGYLDEVDTFDEDAQGMYQVLRGLGVPDDQIQFLSPIDTPGRDSTPTIDHLKAAIASIAAATRPPQPPCDEFVFFLSTHGGDIYLNGNPVYSLDLKSHPNTFEWISGDDLAALLKTVKCKTTTVIVEACESGKLQPILATAISAPTSLRYFLSASHNDPSLPDIDEGDLNPEDVGSETIWGYIEALGTSETDQELKGNQDGIVSFHEAIEYAKQYDASWVNRDSVAWSATTSSDPGNQSAPHSCCAFDTNAKTMIPACGVVTKHKKSVAGYGKTQVVKRCTNAPLWITVRNVGDSVIPVGTLRLFGSVVSQDDVLPENLTALANVALVTDFQPNEQRTYKLRWGVRPNFKKGDRVALFASLDSPLDPAGGKELCIDGGPGATACRAEEHSCLCEVSVVKRCFPIIGCNCRKYAPPEFLPPPE